MLKLNCLSTLADLLFVASLLCVLSICYVASRGGSILVLCPSLSVILGEALKGSLAPGGWKVL